KPDLHPRQTENARVELQAPYAPIIAGRKIAITFRILPNDGLEPYLGAMAHALVASADLIDMNHSHPFQAIDEPGAGAKDLLFENITFPRQGIYRIWIQFQRRGVVNTAFFDVPIAPSL